ncbi:unnamed protein product [Caenorhabditis sp. 36 PRJEB53466]|nr:unnamed protein product [Caenorhabditis sp. 36 PRJEB53466]
MKIFILLFNVFLCVEAGKGSAKSPLGLIVDDLSILARITNAISLQAASHRKIVKVQDVAAEFLGIRTSDLEMIATTNPHNIRENIDGLHEKCADSARRKQSANVELGRMVDVLDTWKKALSNRKMLEMEAKSRPSRFIRVMKNEYKIRELLFCEQEAVEAAAAIHKNLLRANRPRPFRVRKVYERLATHAPTLLKCIENYEVYNRTSPNFDLIIGLYRLMDLDNVFSIVKNFQGPFRKRLKGFTQKMGVLMHDLKESDNIWENRTDHGLTPIFATFQQVAKRKQDKMPETLKYTAGFEEVGDLAKVSDDLKSEWFTEKVSRGTSARELEHSLDAFFKFEKKIMALELSWSTSFAHFTRNSKLIEAAELDLNKVVTFRPADHFDKLQRSQLAYETCWNVTVDVANASVFETFEEGMRAPSEIPHLAQMIRTFGRMVSTTTHFESWSQILKQMHNDLDSKIKRLRDDDVAKFEKSLKKSEHFPTLVTASASFRNLASIQNRYLSRIEKIKASNITAETFDLKDFLAESKFLRAVKCLTTSSHFHISSIDDVIDILTYTGHFVSSKGQLAATRKFLENVGKVKNDVERMMKIREMKEKNGTARILDFKSSEDLALSIGMGVAALRQFDRTYEAREHIRKTMILDPSVVPIIKRFPSVDRIWLKLNGQLQKLLDDLDRLVSIAGKLKGKEVTEMKELFEAAKRIHGFSVDPSALRDLARALENARKRDLAENFRQISQLKLDFVKFEADLTGAAASLSSLRHNFDELFGLAQKDRNRRKVQKYSIFTIIGVCLGIVVLILLAVVIGYGFTKSGRKKYRNWYLYYFPNMDEFERRWRYSMFMDKLDGKNALADAVLEANPTNVLRALKKGAYISVFDKYGNTPLHTAASLGSWRIVEILIKHGADRTILNARNRTAEQTVPTDYQVVYKDRAESFDKVLQVFEKYRKKTFRIEVPEEFPVSSFHIYIEPKTDPKLGEMFMQKFEAISTMEPSPNSTHVVVKTNADGILETDDLNLLVWIFNGAIIVKEQWMSDCLADAKLIGSDEKYVVESVRYKGLVYENAVVPWTTALAKGAMPFLYGVHLVVVMQECPNLSLIYDLARAHGATVLEQFPHKDKYNRGSHPYLHSNLGPIFILHDGRGDLKAYREDVDRMFTVFTEQEFIAFLLKRHVHVDTTKVPIPILVDS